MPTTATPRRRRNRTDYMRGYMEERRAAQHPDAGRYLAEATNLFTSGDPSLRPFVAMVIWRAAGSGHKPAQAALRDPRVSSHVGRMLVRAYVRNILGWTTLPVPKSLAESSTPEVRRVAK